MKKTYLSVLLLLLITVLSAQRTGEDHYCFTDQLWAHQAQQDPVMAAYRAHMDTIISKLANNRHQPVYNNQRSASAAPATVVPIVIYVVYDNDTVNISMAQIQSQVDQLNTNFAAYGFTFCYAQRNVTDTSFFTPQVGDSVGVFRINSALSNVDPYTNDAQLKALSDLPSQSYLRIFVVHSITPEGILGYTQMPGGNAATDGIVMRYDVFGSNNICSTCSLYPTYNLGAALTHECGHFFDLYHTFQGGCDTGSGTAACQIYGDQVCDTPPCDGSYGCPNPAPLSCDGITPELTDNYMDYTDDPCKSAFTPGQNARMIFGTQAYHQTLVSTANLINTGVKCASIGNQYASFYCANYDGCTGMQMTFASLSSPGFTYTWAFGDGATATGDTAWHTYATADKYVVTLTAVDNGLSVNTSTSTPVFITACTPTTCPYNKFDFEYGYLDFSSGTPVATNHAATTGNPNFSDIFNLYYRGDTLGNPLMHIGPRNYYGQFSTTLFDTSFNIIDSLNNGFSSQTILPPLPMHNDMYCLIENYITQINPNGQGGITDTLKYTVLSVTNGEVSAVPNKRLVTFPPQAPGSSTGINYYLAAIPNCDGSAIWIVTCTVNGYLVFKLDSSGTITYNSQYAQFSNSFYISTFIASPDGRTLAMGWMTSSPGNEGIYLLSFDKANGVITNGTQLYNITPNYYPDWSSPKVFFSPNSRYVYYIDACCASEDGNTESLCQSDMFSPNPYATRKIIYQYPLDNSASGPYVDMKEGPDKKLYIGNSTFIGNAPAAYRLGVINYPDVAENGYNSTGYNPNGPDVTPPNCPYTWGFNLDGFHGYYDRTDAFGCDWRPSVPNPFSYMAQGCLSYRFYSDECWSSSWNFGNASSGSSNTSTLSQPVHSFSAPGNYTVQLLINGYTFTDTVHIAAPVAQISATPVNPCPVPNSSYSVAVIQPYVNYAWTVTNGTPATASGQPFINVQWNQPGTGGSVMLIATDTVMGCVDTSYLNVSFTLSGSSFTSYITDSICPGTNYPFGGHNLTTPGTYTDTAVLGQGCTAISILTLSYRQPVDVTWTGGADTSNTNTGGILLNGGLPAGGTYSGTGVSGNTFYPGQVAGGAYTITYTYTAANGCSGTATREFIVNGIEVISNQSSTLTIYPNPANDQLNIKTENIQPITTTIYDLNGRIICTMPFKPVIDINQLSSGVYFIEVTSTEGVARKKFMKM